MIAAPIRADARPSIDALLESMARQPGLADPGNAVLPFGRFPRIHFARLLLLDDQTLADRAHFPNLYFPCPVRLALLVVCDGPAEAQIDELAEIAGDGLRRLFGHCEDLDEGKDLRRWLHSNTIRSATFYMNWPGRTVRPVARGTGASRRASRGAGPAPLRLAGRDEAGVAGRRGPPGA